MCLKHLLVLIYDFIKKIIITTNYNILIINNTLILKLFSIDFIVLLMMKY